MLLLLLLTNAFVLLPWAGAGRIIGGMVSKVRSRPYMAFLESKNATNIRNCGGFLIRPDAVLSAAHCVDMQGRPRVTVILGAHNISDEECSQQKISVARWFIHPQYSRERFKNDIVLLKLEQNATINEYVKCISIPKKNKHVRVGTKCNVPGWGWTSKEEDRTDVLREVELKVQKEKICQRTFSDYEPQSMICVGDEKRKKAVYKGDSGGPLVCNKKAHGIVSYGCDCNLFPEAFTRISHFAPWIHQQLKMFSLQDTPGSPSSD
ncbi:cathepsin G-like [Melospiza melodia melodia]|uniref:cathepsin G-like n=1 Tax=Melospiza melodia melodia TaxID=1914991 RepID=UPI002FD4A6AC